MKLTTRGHYSVKALLDLSFTAKVWTSVCKEIATRQDIPALPGEIALKCAALS